MLGISKLTGPLPNASQNTAVSPLHPDLFPFELVAFCDISKMLMTVLARFDQEHIADLAAVGLDAANSHFVRSAVISAPRQSVSGSP